MGDHDAGSLAGLNRNGLSGVYVSVQAMVEPKNESPPGAGDGSFDDLYSARGPAMLRLATLLVDEPAAAADIVQDAFVQLYRRWDRVDAPEAYLRRSVVNGASSALRRRRVKRTAEERLPHRSSSFDVVDELSDSLRILTARQRAVVVLRFYADLPEAEIAAVLGVRPGTVKSTLHTALRRLRLELSDDG